MMKMMLNPNSRGYTTTIPTISMTNSQETSSTLTNTISSPTSGSFATKSSSPGTPPPPDATEHRQPDKDSESIEQTQLSPSKSPPSDDERKQSELQPSSESTTGQSPIASPS